MKFINLIFLSVLMLNGCQKQDVEWSSFGNDLTNQRYSRLDQINTENIKFIYEYPLSAIGFIDTLDDLYPNTCKK